MIKKLIFLVIFIFIIFVNGFLFMYFDESWYNRTHKDMGAKCFVNDIALSLKYIKLKNISGPIIVKTLKEEYKTIRQIIVPFKDIILFKLQYSETHFKCDIYIKIRLDNKKRLSKFYIFISNYSDKKLICFTDNLKKNINIIPEGWSDHKIINTITQYERSRETVAE